MDFGGFFLGSLDLGFEDLAFELLGAVRRFLAVGADLGVLRRVLDLGAVVLEEGLERRNLKQPLGVSIEVEQLPVLSSFNGFLGFGFSFISPFS